jgi:hypothetical protein
VSPCGYRCKAIYGDYFVFLPFLDFATKNPSFKHRLEFGLRTENRQNFFARSTLGLTGPVLTSLGGSTARWTLILLAACRIAAAMAALDFFGSSRCVCLRRLTWKEGENQFLATYNTLQILEEGIWRT